MFAIFCLHEQRGMPVLFLSLRLKELSRSMLFSTQFGRICYSDDLIQFSGSPGN